MMAVVCAACGGGAGREYETGIENQSAEYVDFMPLPERYLKKDDTFHKIGRNGKTGLSFQYMSNSDLILLSNMVWFDSADDYCSDLYFAAEESDDPFCRHIDNELNRVKPVSYLNYDGCLYFDEDSFRETWIAYLVTSRYDFDDFKSEIGSFVESVNGYCIEGNSFPVGKYREILQWLNHEYAYFDNHASETIPSALSMQFIAEQGLSAVRSIRDVADLYTDDDKAGLLILGSGYNYNYNQTVCLFESEYGIWLNLWDNGSPNDYNKIFHIAENGKDYYICFRDYQYDLNPRLFVNNNGIFGNVALDFYDLDFDLRESGWYSGEDDEKIVYNPREYKWNWCYYDGTYYQQVKGTKTLRLKFNGDKVKLIAEYRLIKYHL